MNVLGSFAPKITDEIWRLPEEEEEKEEEEEEEDGWEDWNCEDNEMIRCTQGVFPESRTEHGSSDVYSTTTGLLSSSCSKFCFSDTAVLGVDAEGSDVDLDSVVDVDVGCCCCCCCCSSNFAIAHCSACVFPDNSSV